MRMSVTVLYGVIREDRALCNGAVPNPARSGRKQRYAWAPGCRRSPGLLLYSERT